LSLEADVGIRSTPSSSLSDLRADGARPPTTKETNAIERSDKEENETRLEIIKIG